jgi:hypothetical protein
MAPFKKKSYPVPLADLVAGAVDPVLAKQGFGQSSLILHWDDIVGERLAACSEPIKLQWPARPVQSHPDSGVEPATLVLRVTGGMAIEVQHMAQQLIERVNAHLGWRAVGRIALRQGPLSKGKKPPRIGPPEPAAVAEAEKATEGVTDEELHKALVRLGARALRGKAGQA